mmetsp:Transcript_17416/g.33058  ORF Transcript_17416/g.33058 Transcript_17416/m.33058 type:complete len:318 (-) Transcript_17416:171-1124(-)
MTMTLLQKQRKYGVFLLSVCLVSTDVWAFAPSSTASTHGLFVGKTVVGSPLSPLRRRIHSHSRNSINGRLYSTFNEQQQDQAESSSLPNNLLLKNTPPPSSSTNNSNTSVEPTWVDESKHVELVGLIAWMVSISAFILMNNFVGPWPAALHQVPERVYFLGHMLGGMLFGGGVVLTTAIEWMVAKNKNPAVMQFWFDKVPLLDMALVLPGLTLSMFSGTGLTIVRYGGLALAPPHIVYAFWALVAFAAWWAFTDLTTQGSALNAVMEAHAALPDEVDEFESVPDEVSGRTVSNVVSCLLVLVMYGIMVLKPGTLHYF